MVRANLRRADHYKSLCKLYMRKIDFHVPKQYRLMIEIALGKRPDLEGDILLTEPLCLANCEAPFHVTEPSNLDDDAELTRLGHKYRCYAAGCKKPLGDDPKKCGRCRAAVYCGKRCQVADWKSHKLKCEPRTSSKQKKKKKKKR